MLNAIATVIVTTNATNGILSHFQRRFGKVAGINQTKSGPASVDFHQQTGEGG